MVKLQTLNRFLFQCKVKWKYFCKTVKMQNRTSFFKKEKNNNTFDGGEMTEAYFWIRRFCIFCYLLYQIWVNYYLFSQNYIYFFTILLTCFVHLFCVYQATTVKILAIFWKFELSKKLVLEIFICRFGKSMLFADRHKIRVF